jgi:hypothetical protein
VRSKQVRNALVVISLFAGALSACSKNADGDMVIQTPRVESHTDTVKMPHMQVTKDTIVTVTPTVVVKKETSMVTVPHVSVSRKP